MASSLEGLVGNLGLEKLIEREKNLGKKLSCFQEKEFILMIT